MSVKGFTKGLMNWDSKSNDREMPWKGEKDAYKVWISEIILQQTRVGQGLSYYNRFISRFPNIKKLAEAKDEDVYKLWEGLGYYSRCRNLIHTARYIYHDKKAVFPSTYEEIVSLKGIGPYTAAAISSFVFGAPHAVVDGNVIRVLSRYFGISISPDSSEGKRVFRNLAQSALYDKDPGRYNQAIMDFGATVCKPVPECTGCPLRKSCLAFQKNAVQQFPVKKQKPKIRQRHFYYIVMNVRGKWVYRKRPSGDIWHNLHEFILIESPASRSPRSILKEWLAAHKDMEGKEISKPYFQKLTHQTISATFIRVDSPPAAVPEGYRMAQGAAMRKKAFPRVIAGYIREKGLF